MTIIDVDSWSKAVANEYLTHGTSLNNSIVKIASEHGLNRDQISRVVEAANTEVYINLFNKAQDKYIHYDTADSEKIAEQIFGKEKTSSISDTDYQELPTGTDVLEIPISTPMVKTAEVSLNTTNNEALHEYYKIAALDTRLGQSLDETEMHYQTDSSILYSMIKQAVLGGVSFGDVERVLTSVYNNPVIEINVKETKEKLAQELYPKPLSSEVTYTGTVNMENPLVKQAGLLLKHAQEFATLKTKHVETRNRLLEHLKTSSILKNLAKPLGNMGQAISKEPIGAAALLATGAVAGGIGVNQISKKRKEQSAMKQEMKTLPSAYVR